MKTIFYQANSRGYANHGWLEAQHSFSFARYFNQDRMGFGALRVLNDDTVKGGMGFSSHPHQNMEIITIPLEGDLKHSDNMGNTGIISKGEVQVMSAGTGIFHSEKNANATKDLKLLQIWILPKVENVEPRYEQLVIKNQAKPNDFQQIVSPNNDDAGVWIHQEAWFHLAIFEKGITKTYKLKNNSNGVFVFVIEGTAKIGNQVLEKRDAIGITEVSDVELQALENSEILLIEVPMDGE